MADNAANDATELPEGDVHLDDSNEAKNETPVRDAFNRGVLGGDLPNVPIPKDSDAKPAPVLQRHEAPPIDLSREASSFLDQARGFAAEIAKIKTDTADRLLEAAEPVLDKLDAVLETIEATKLERERAIAATSALYENLPVDPETKKKVQQSAAQKAHDDLMAVRSKELEALARQVVEAAERAEKQLEFEEAFADSDFRQALDGERRPEERTSMDYLTSRFEEQSVAEIERSYDLMQLDTNRDRVVRFERAALKALDSILSRRDQDIAKGITRDQPEEKLNEAKRERAAAAKLRNTLRAAQASRQPKAIAHAKALVTNLKTAWQRLAGFDARHGAGAVSASEMNSMRNDDSKMAQARAAAKSWRPVEGWTGRHFRPRKAK